MSIEHSDADFRRSIRDLKELDARLTRIERILTSPNRQVLTKAVIETVSSINDTSAIHFNVDGEMNDNLEEKTVIVDADLLLIEDSEASNAKKKVQVTNIVDSLKAEIEALGLDVAIANLPFGNAGEQLTTNEAETAMELVLASKYFNCRKGSVGTISAGAPVYIDGYNVGGWVEVEEADADDPTKMPCVGIAFEAITNSAQSRVLMFGVLTAQDTSSYSVGDELYVSTTAGTLTSTKPTGTAAIQKVGVVSRSNVAIGSIIIFGAGRSNDVPNLADGLAWIGDGSGVATPTDIDARAIAAVEGEATLDLTGAVTIAETIKNNVDNKGFYSGASDDLRVYHDGTYSWFYNSASGGIVIRNIAGDVPMYIDLGGVFYIRDSDDGAAQLYKLDTSARTLAIGASADLISTTQNGDLVINSSGNAQGGRVFIDTDDGTYNPRVRLYKWQGSGTIYHVWGIYEDGSGNLHIGYESSANGIDGAETFVDYLSINTDGAITIPYLAGAPAGLTNGMMWMESDGLHIYYAGAEKIVAGV